MKFDFSFIDALINNDKPADLVQIKQTRAYQTIQKHCKITGNNFDLSSTIQSLQRQGPHVLHKIKQLSQPLTYAEDSVKTILEEQIHHLYPNEDTAQLVCCFAVGYDVGIGLNNCAVINLASPMLTSIKDVTAILIHELTHTVFERYVGPIAKHCSFLSKPAIKHSIDYLIQYEGIGIYAAKTYREENNLPTSGFAPYEDYHVSPQRKTKLIELYHAVQTQLSPHNPTIEMDILNNVFGPNRLPHCLGYELVHQLHTEGKTETIREVAKMDSETFTTTFLNFQR